MNISPETFLIVGAILLIVSVFVSKLGSRFGVPTLLLFLFVGMAFGTDGLGIEFDSMEDAQFVGVVALNIILFSGGLDTKYKEIRPIMLPGVLLSTVGVLITAFVTGAFVYFVSHSLTNAIICSFPFALLLASTMSSTDSASVFNILRTQNIKLKHNLQPMLELESGSNDPVAYMLTIAMIGVLKAIGDVDITWTQVAINIIKQLLIGAAFGWIFGKVVVFTMNKIKLNNGSLYPILLVAFIFLTYTAASFLGGNGYLAIYIAGIIAGNSPMVKKRECRNFLDGLTWTFQIIMFLLLGLLVNPHELEEVALFAIVLGAFMILVARPLSIFLTLLPFRKITAKSKIFLSWVGLRGAVPILFATYPVIANIEGARSIFNIVFVITLMSLIVQGMTIPFFAKKLDLIDKSAKDETDFGIIFPEEMDSKMWDIDVTPETIKNGNKISDVKFEDNIRIVLIKRKQEYIVPSGQTELIIGDKLLMISAN